MASIFLAHVPNRFNLAVPSEAWLKPIADYDADLRIYPSQTKPLFRLGRLARLTGGLSFKTFKDIPGVHPDTRVALLERLVAVTTIPAAALGAPAENIVRQLRGRDQWVLGQGRDGDAGDRIADLLDQRDAANALALRQSISTDGRDRHRAARISLLYRLGARVSLVRPPKSLGVASPSEGSPPAGIPPVAGATTP